VGFGVVAEVEVVGSAAGEVPFAWVVGVGGRFVAVDLAETGEDALCVEGVGATAFGLVEAGCHGGGLGWGMVLPTL